MGTVRSNRPGAAQASVAQAVDELRGGDDAEDQWASELSRAGSESS